MRCEACEGTGWRKRLVPHPYAPGTKIYVTSVCRVCNGTRSVEIVSVPSGKDKAANEKG